MKSISKIYILENEIKNQLDKIKAGNPTIKLVRPCRIDDGILTINPIEQPALIRFFDKTKEDLNFTFFIPASGSGSRMFDNMFDFLNPNNEFKDEAYKAVVKFLNRISDFALYNKIPYHIKKNIKNGIVDVTDLIEYVLLEKGLNLGSLPKGLIPFHRYGKFMITPFQEHIIQGAKIGGDSSNFHFTINPIFSAKIKESIEVLRAITGIDFNYNFSEQDEKSNSYTFNEKNEAIKLNNGSYLQRPSGHGALISNLNKIESDIIFIKNIDNVQHYTKAYTSIDTQKVIAATLLKFQQTVFELLNAIDENSETVYSVANELNNQFNLKISDTELKRNDFLKSFFNRPIRICGMVKNEGQPGGGPFWVQENNTISQQIIEKSQINSADLEQRDISIHATHFNPVNIVCAIKNYKNEKFNLLNYSNPNLYFLVRKKNKGEDIKYIEQPGLWNGGMHNWLTLFYEIDSACFSPVKTIMDLLNPLHIEK